LGFPSQLDREAYEALGSIRATGSAAILLEDEGLDNLFSYLWRCDATEEEYRRRGIPDKILTDTLGDIPIWCRIWSEIKGRLYLGETAWLKNHLDPTLFRLGRLEFKIASSFCDIPKYGIFKGDPVTEIHIPEGDRLTSEACRESIEAAREFFPRYYPEHSFSVFTCHSWLLDEGLLEYLPEDSGIARFGDMFDRIHSTPSHSLIKYLFRWDITPEGLASATPRSGLASWVKSSLLSGRCFFETLGVIKR
jgi:hypothetical protein